jgi:DNA-binding MarR family transcriptional regulator
LSEEWLKLENQLCFPFYAVSRLITRRYQPLLDELNITYPQYLVMMVLWEQDGVPIQHLSDTLLLNTNTLTPLLKRLEKQGLIVRTRSRKDERVVTVTLKPEGIKLRERALHVPQSLLEGLQYPLEELAELRDSMARFLKALRNTQ